MENIIVTESVKQSFPVASGGEYVALRNISIRIPEGKLTILRGRSGSGKTTLMNILSALDYPKAGEVVFDGKNLEKMSETQREEFRKNNVGFVFQSVALIPMMTAFENVEFLLRLAKYPGNKRKRAEECLKLVGLGQRMHHMPQELSGGEQQRVAIARALINRPKVLLADEPTGNLDHHNAIEIMKLLDEINQRGTTVLVVTHNQEIVRAMKKRVITMEQGVVISDEQMGGYDREGYDED